MGNLAGIGGWKPGQSGNPMGRPRLDPSVKRLLKRNALQAAQAIVDGLDPKQPIDTRMDAAEKLLNRLYGRPAQTLNLGTDDNVKELSDAELIARLSGRDEDGNDLYDVDGDDEPQTDLFLDKAP